MYEYAVFRLRNQVAICLGMFFIPHSVSSSALRSHNSLGTHLVLRVGNVLGNRYGHCAMLVVYLIGVVCRLWNGRPAHEALLLSPSPLH